MIRYQIRNEYGLSDPELYAAAPGEEEDDPEALLEGVAMAGLAGVLRQLGDLAEFAAEIFHDLHEDVMATASRGHSLMLRLQQLEAEFPAVEKAIISQSDHSNYPHDEGVEWHANLQLNQNVITQGDMPRFILDSYEECRGPPHLFTLDKFDVAGAGASLKRYSDPSFFKTEHASNVIETDVLMEKKPRRIKKKTMRWRKGATLKSLLIASSEFPITPKDRTSRKVPPRTTKLKSRHPRSPDHQTVSRICREHLQEVILSQQKILSRYSASHYHVKFRSTDSSETASPFGEMDNFGAYVQSSGKLELTKVVPVNESDAVEAKSTTSDGSAYLELGDKQVLEKQNEHYEENGMIRGSEELPDCPNFQVAESNQRNLAHEEKPVTLRVPAGQDIDGCTPDDIGSDQDNFIDASHNSMSSEGEADPETRNEPDPSANVEGIELNCRSKEDENELYEESPEVGPAIDSLPGLKGSCDGGEPTCMDSPLLTDSAPAMSATNGPNSGGQIDGTDWTNDEPFNDEDLMDVSSSSSVVSDNADLQTNDNLIDYQQNQEEAFHSIGDDHAAIILDPDKQSPNMSSGLDGMALNKNNYIGNSMEHRHDTYLVSSKPNDFSEDDQISFGIADDLFLHPTKLNQQEIHDLKKELDEGKSLDTDTPPDKLASLPDKNHVAVPEDIVSDTAPTGLEPDDIHEHHDGIAGNHPSMHSNLLYESYDAEIAEHMHSLPDDGLSTFNKHVAEDHQISVLEQGTCPTSCNIHIEDSKQAPAMARDVSDAQDLPGVIHGLSPSQKENSPHEGETLAPASSVFNDDTEPLETGVLLAPSTSSVLDISSACVEQQALTEMEDIAEGGNVDVGEESTTGSFADDVVPPEEEFIGNTTTNSTEEASRQDVQLLSSSLREGLETTEATQRNLGADEPGDRISEETMLQTDNIPPLIQIETAGVKSGDRDGIQFLPPANFPEESCYQDEFLEEASHNAEVLTLFDSDKDEALTLRGNAVWKPPVDVDHDLAWGMPSQDSSSTNPFMDPAYMASHTQVYPSPSTSCQPCFPEGQDFLSELLVQHDKMDPAADSLWEPATPPDEAPLPSEVMTEADFRSFCHEYHEIDFLTSTQGCHDETASDWNNISDAFLVRESDFPCSVPASPVKLDQETCVDSKFGSQCVESSFAADIRGTTAVSFSGKEIPEEEKPRVYSDLQDSSLFSDNRNPELDMLSAQVGLQQEQDTYGVDSHSPPLLENEKTGEECSSPSSNIVEVKQELEILADLCPQSFINENVDKLDVAVPVEPEIKAHALDEYDNQDVPCCSTDEQNNNPTLGKPVLLQESEVCVSGEFDSPIIPLSSIDEIKDNLEASPLRTSFEPEQESEWCTSDEHDSQIAQSSLHHEKIDELDRPPLSNAALLDQESEDCVPRGLDSRIPPCSSTDDSRYGLDHAPLGSSVLMDLQSEDRVLGDCHSQVTPCSLVKDKIDESKDAQPNCILPEELEQESHGSSESDSQVVRCSMHDEEVGQIDGAGAPLIESEYDCSTEFDSQTLPCSSNSGAPAERTALNSACIMPSVEEISQLPPTTPPTVPFPNDSHEDPDKPPPLPPLQWRLGRPRLGFLSKNVCMAEPARRTEPVLQASSQDMDNRNRLDLLDGVDRSIKPVSSQATGEDTYSSCMMDNNDQSVEFGRSAASVAVNDVARTEHKWPFSETPENIKQEGHISSSAIKIEEHLDDTGFTSAAAVEKHLDSTGIAHDAVLYPSNPHASENSGHSSHTHPATYEDEKSIDGHIAGSMVTSITGHISESRYYQQPQHGELFSETSDHEQRIPVTSKDEGVTHHSNTNEVTSDQADHSASGMLLEEGNSQGSQNFQKQNVESAKNDQLGGPLPREESMAPHDFPHDEHNLERENIRQPSGPGLFVVWPGDKSNMVSGLDETSYPRSEEPPVMGWTVGPQMIHPKYGISIEDSEFEPNMTDNHLTKKPLSVRNIPRNPLVDAVAAHDRSSMRKVSELAPPIDKPKSEERNLLLEQIRNKTFNLKPVAPDMPTSMRSPARVNTRNLKLAAIIEKANAIRQAVGSDDEDADSWSDA